MGLKPIGRTGWKPVSRGMHGVFTKAELTWHAALDGHRFEVCSLGKGDGVIKGVAGRPECLPVMTEHLAGGALYGVAEVSVGNMGAAGGCQQGAAWPEQLERIEREVVIGVNATFALGFAFSQGRWIGDDQSEPGTSGAGCFRKPGKSVVLIAVMPGRGDGRMAGVEGKVPASTFEGVGGDIQIRHRRSPAARGIEGKSSTEAECVKDGSGHEGAGDHPAAGGLGL